MIFDALKKLMGKNEKAPHSQSAKGMVLSRIAFPGGYKSPSGGFCNYARFSGRGINPATGRSNQIKVVYAKTLDEALAKAEKETGFQNIELSLVPMDPPTEKQMGFAKELRIQIPSEACKEDMICLISRVADSLEDEPIPGCPQSFANYLDKAGLQFSAYISEPMALEWAANMLPTWEKCRFYAYCVWCHSHNESLTAPDIHPNADLFSAFADRFADDTAFLQGLHKKSVLNFLHPNGNESTVKIAKAFFGAFDKL